jgi:hemerythrin-like domain-containing protein
MSTNPAPRKVREARKAVAVPSSFEALDQTHAEVMRMLAEFALLLQHVDDNGADEHARASARRLSDFFSGTAHQHHAEEERLVFPAVKAGGDAQMIQHIERLQQDHGWLEEDWHELSPQIEAIAMGYSWYDLNHLRHALPVFEALYREHIALEESLIYPEARRRLEALAEGRRAEDR